MPRSSKRSLDDMYSGDNSVDESTRGQVIVKECSWFRGLQKHYTVFKAAGSPTNSTSTDSSMCIDQ